jgi:ribonuclease BN (tRNA processing enzyme)
MPFEVVVLGNGDAFSDRRRPTSFLLRAGGATLAVDCPDAYRAVLREAGEKSGLNLAVEDVQDLLLTHLHGDHVNGLEALGFLQALILKRRLRLWTTPEVLEVIWEQRLRAAMSWLWNGREFMEKRFEDFFDPRPLAWTEENAIGPFRVKIRRTVHHIPTSALLVEAEGKRWGYSCDTAFDPGLIEFLEPADEIFHETNYGPAHTPIAALEALPQHIRAKVRLVHVPDDFREGSCAMPVAQQGDVVRV